jgi:deoxyribodipyrimidine photolyase-related protein
MLHFKDALEQAGLQVKIIQTSSQDSIELLSEVLQGLGQVEISYYELTDDWLQRRVEKMIKQLGIQAFRLESPGFLTSQGMIEDYFDNNPNRMQYFYEWQRKRLKILVEGVKPVGGKWSYDVANRKKLPKNIELPAAYSDCSSQYFDLAIKWVEKDFADNPGYSESFHYPVTHEQATRRLDQFLKERFENFGPYEDSISKDSSEVFHSVLSPMMNIGLLTPKQVVDAALQYNEKHEVPIESLEGFIRQIIGWREYMRATYIRFGSKMRTGNYLQFNRPLDKSWLNGTVGIEPIDTVIDRVLKTGYAHHIERLMILGNSMVLLRIDPDKVYEWFMIMFIDAYDWVMVPNVYAMSQFAAGEMITTKPYISGSNYIIKMSDYTKGEWSATWDALYWQFIADNRKIIEKNYRTKMVVSLYDRFDDDKKKQIQANANNWLK